MEEIKSDLSTYLWSLCKKIGIKINECKTNGSLFQIPKLYLKYKVTNFKYKEEGGCSFQRSCINLEKEEWQEKALNDFIENIVKNLQEYTMCTLEISKTYNISDEQSVDSLYKFCHRLISQSATQSIDDPFIVSQIIT